MHEAPNEIDAAWDFADPAASEARFAAMLAEAGRAADEPRAAAIRTQIARAQGLQRRFADAHQTLDQVEQWLDAASADHAHVRVRLLLERGRVLNSSGRATDAAPIFARAWQLATLPKHSPAQDGLAVDAAHMAAIVAAPTEAMAWHTRALALAESSPNPDARRWRGSLLNNMGWTLFAAGDHAGALTLFERALAARIEQGTDGKGRGPWLTARWCIARAHRALGRIDDALAEQRDLLEEHTRAGSTDGFVHEEIAECLLALGSAIEARPHFAAAYELLSKDPWLAEREAERIARLRKISQ